MVVGIASIKKDIKTKFYYSRINTNFRRKVIFCKTIFIIRIEGCSELCIVVISHSNSIYPCKEGLTVIEIAIGNNCCFSSVSPRHPRAPHHHEEEQHEAEGVLAKCPEQAALVPGAAGMVLCIVVVFILVGI